MNYEHFKGKVVAEHLGDARQKGFLVSSEVHDLEVSGFWVNLAESGKEAAIFCSFIALILHFAGIPIIIIVRSLALLALPFTLWKALRSLLLGYAKMERMHKLIEEEKYEIEHHREQEKEEMTQMYSAKGLEEPLLSQVVEVLMADQNRLLEIMLTEELGLKLECMDHPLKQAIGSGLGAFGAFFFMLLAGVFFGIHVQVILSLVLLFLLSILSAKKLGVELIFSSIWFTALGGASLILLYFLSHKIFL